MRTRRRLWRVASVLLCIVMMLTSCRIPQDMEGTLEKVAGHHLDVGVTENPPWVIEAEGGPVGVEVDMVRDFARELGAQVRWHWGTEGSLVSALQSFQLDMAVGGLEKKPWLRAATASSRVFFDAMEMVGFPPGTEVPPTLKGVRVAVHPVNAVGGRLEEHGAIPVRAQEVPPDMPVAAPLWWLQGHGYTPGPWLLGKRHHVWLLPNGENAWILRVDRHLAKYDEVAERLREAGGSR